MKTPWKSKKRKRGNQRKHLALTSAINAIALSLLASISTNKHFSRYLNCLNFKNLSKRPFFKDDSFVTALLRVTHGRYLKNSTCHISNAKNIIQVKTCEKIYLFDFFSLYHSYKPQGTDTTNISIQYTL